jgi:mRNA interferase MazF
MINLFRAKMRRGEVRYDTFASPDKRRPVLRLSRDEAIRVLNDIVVAPITTTIRNLPTFVLLTEADGMPRLCAANMDQIQLAPKHLLSDKITELGAARIAEVDRALMIALGVCDA